MLKGACKVADESRQRPLSRFWLVPLPLIVAVVFGQVLAFTVFMSLFDVVVTDLETGSVIEGSNVLPWHLGPVVGVVLGALALFALLVGAADLREVVRCGLRSVPRARLVRVAVGLVLFGLLAWASVAAFQVPGPPDMIPMRFR